MRLFASILKRRTLVILAPKPSVEIAVVSAEVGALLNYNTLHKSALAHERRSINQCDRA